jgi:hypothetical protein
MKLDELMSRAGLSEQDVVTLVGMGADLALDAIEVESLELPEIELAQRAYVVLTCGQVGGEQDGQA